MQNIGIESPAIGRARRFDRFLGLAATTLVLAACLVQPQNARADMVLTAPDGRKIQLKDDGTWSYQDAADKGKVDAKEPPEVMADLRLERRIERGTNCRLVFSLTNTLPYEIRHIVPYFSVYRANGVVHETVSAAFQSIRPSDRIERMADFSRIACPDIARVQVTGGDRCEMGDLHKFSPANGECLARVRAAPSDLIRFDK